MHIDKWVKCGVVATVLCAVFGGWQTYRSEFPKHPQQANAGMTGASLPVSAWWPFAASSVLLLGSVLIAFWPRKEKRSVDNIPSKAKKLVIHSAFYGVDAITDQSVLEVLAKNATDGFVIPVNNNALGCDPAPNRPEAKRLRVVYSYGNDVKREAIRYEHTRMVLPIDEEFIQSRAKEYEAKRLADVKTTAHTAALEILKCEADACLKEYQHLDHDHREEVKLPLNNHSWPAYGAVWSFIEIRLYTIRERLEGTTGLARALWERAGWDAEFVGLFKLNQHTKMLDVISALEEFAALKPSVGVET